MTRKDKNQKESYIGLTENRFKTRYRNHLSSFKDEKKKYDTELSKYVWALKKNDIEYNINWKIVQQYPSYTNDVHHVQQRNLLYCEKTKKPPKQADRDHVNLWSSTEISAIKSLIHA